MADDFVLELHYKGAPVTIPGELRVFGYTYKIAMDIGGVEVLFEPDEERNFRAIVPETDLAKIDRKLVELAAEKLQEVFK